MNSQYKFRAWDKEWKEMQMVRDIYFDTKSGEVEYFITKGNFATYTGYPKTHVLMQCTGLKDKNGIEIYEGDIVKSQNGTGGLIYRHFVEWNDFYKGFEPMGAEGSCFNRESCEVIGNIYENPELLDKH